MKIELGKDDQYQTRDGCKVRIHAIDLNGPCPVLFSMNNGGKWQFGTCKPNGEYTVGEHKWDIVPAPVVREYWVNVYTNPEITKYVFTSESLADSRSSTERLAKLHIRYRDCDIKDGVIELRSWSDK